MHWVKLNNKRGQNIGVDTITSEEHEDHEE